MKFRNVKMILIMLVFAILLLSSKTNADTTINGTLVTADGQPVANHLIGYSMVSDSISQTVESDAEGNFSIIGISGGTYTLLPLPDEGCALVDSNYVTIQVNEGETVDDVVLELPCSKIIAYYSGVVQNPDNQPIENVKISAFYALTDTTNTNGEFMLEYYTLPPIDTLQNGDTAHISVIHFSHSLFEFHQETVQINEGDNTASQVIILELLPDQFTVSGTIKDADDNLISNAQVVLFNTNYISTFHGSTDENGTYQISVDEGSYYVQADVLSGTVTEWYDNVTDLSEATILHTTSDTTINFVFDIPEAGSISGKVIDRATSQPIENAMMWVQTPSTGDSIALFTDANGNYTVNNLFDGSPIIAGKSYYIFCEKEGYVPLVYDNVENFFDATPVVITENNLNVTGIDFSLYTPSSQGTNSIEGTISDTAGNPVADIEILAIKPTGEAYIEKSDNHGNYLFAHLSDDSYYILAYKDKKYAPSYYKDAPIWENATKVELTGHTIASNINIQLIPIEDFGAQIHGSILSSSSTSEKLLREGGLIGAVVSVYNKNGKLISGGVSNFDGTFITSGLPNGSYTLKASRIGYHTKEHLQEINVDLSSTPTVKGITITLDALPTSVEDNKIHDYTPNQFYLDQNFPNPGNPVTSIRYGLPEASNVKIIIYDILGQKIHTLVNAHHPAGSYQITWNGRDDDNLPVSSGIYLYTIQTDNFIQTKRMILLK